MATADRQDLLGTVCVLLHGFATFPWFFRWWGGLEQLEARGARVLTPRAPRLLLDWRAGDEHRLADQVRALEARRVVVGGNSDGCKPAVRLALRYPHLVHGLVFVGGVFQLRDLGDRTLRVPTLVVDAGGDRTPAGTGNHCERFYAWAEAHRGGAAHVTYRPLPASRHLWDQATTRAVGDWIRTLGKET